MIVDGLKRYLPRGLYGRAALILLVPIVAIQLIVSTAFIQRYFADVSEQMTGNLVIEVNYLLRRIDQATTLAEAQADIMSLAPQLGVNVELPATQAIQPVRAIYDLSGIAVARKLRSEIDGIRVIDLGPEQKTVKFQIDTRHGPGVVSFSRSRVSPSNPHQLLVIMVLAGVLLTVISYIFLRNQLRPIKRLAETAEAFGKGRSEPYVPVGATEVRAAGQAFLDMRERIERQLEQRTLMLSGVSHDLRTPLTRLRLGLSLIDATGETEAMEGDVEEMETLIAAFLDFARGDVTETPVVSDPGEIIARSVEKGRRGGKSVSLSRGYDGPSVPLRPIAIGRALDNLVGNAVRYGTRAEVSVSHTPSTLTFCVEDDGPGIPQSQREQAMQPFVRLDPGRNQNRGSGVGLGLAIAFDITRSHGGTLTLGTSDTLGGLKAEISLPL